MLIRLTALLLSSYVVAAGTAYVLASPSDGNSAASLQNKTVQLAKAGRYADALKVGEQAAELNPNNASLHRWLTVINTELHRTDAAAREAITALQLDPQNANSHYNLATLLEGSGQAKAAIAEYRQAISLGKNDIATYRGLYQCMAQTELLKESISGLEQMSKRSPDEAAVWLALSEAYLRYGDGDGALYAVQQAVKLAPNWYPALKCQALIELDTHRPAEARLTARKLITIDSQQEDGYRFMVRVCCQGSNDYNLAQWTTQQALSHQSNNPALLTYLAVQCIKPAIRDGKLAKNQAPDRSLRWLALGERLLHAALETSSNNLTTNYQLARVLLLERKPWEALPCAKKAYELDPKNTEARALYLRATAATNDLAGELRRWLHRGT